MRHERQTDDAKVALITVVNPTPKKSPIFKQARQNRIFQDVIEQIQEAILDGQLKAGDTLPPERELKEMFNTSRGTVREALRVLEERGLIQIKLGVGGGAVIRTVTPERASESIGLLIRSNRVSLDHLAELREGIEGNVASLAAARATATAISPDWRPLSEDAGALHRGT